MPGTRHTGPPICWWSTHTRHSESRVVPSWRLAGGLWSLPPPRSGQDAMACRRQNIDKPPAGAVARAKALRTQHRAAPCVRSGRRCPGARTRGVGSSGLPPTSRTRMEGHASLASTDGPTSKGTDIAADPGQAGPCPGSPTWCSAQTSGRYPVDGSISPRNHRIRALCSASPRSKGPDSPNP